MTVVAANRATRRFFTTEDEASFYITEADEAWQAHDPSHIDRQTAWNRARAQRKPVFFVDLSGASHVLGTVYDPNVAWAAMKNEAASHDAAQERTTHETKPVVHGAPESEPAREGFYQLGNEIYKVMKNRARTRSYARRLAIVNRKPEWDYAAGMVYKLTEAERLTRAQAKAFGDLHHFCLCCGRELTRPESIEAGIGPVCAKRLW